LRSPNRLEERLGLELVSKSAELTFQGRDISARARRIWLLRVRGCRGGIRVRFESRDAALRNARFDDGVEMPGLAEHLRLELGVHVRVVELRQVERSKLLKRASAVRDVAMVEPARPSSVST